MDETRILLPATVAPVVAYLWVRDHADTLRAMEATGRALVISGPNEAFGRQALQSVGEIREAARKWRERQDHITSGRGSISARGNAELPQEPEPAESGVSTWGKGPGLTSREVAGQLGLSRKQVTNLVRAGERLAGHLVPGYGWVIDELSVAAELERRRPT